MVRPEEIKKDHHSTDKKGYYVDPNGKHDTVSEIEQDQTGNVSVDAKDPAFSQ